MKHKIILLPISCFLLVGCNGLMGSKGSISKEAFLEKFKTKTLDCDVLKSFDDSFVLKQSASNSEIEKKTENRKKVYKNKKKEYIRKIAKYDENSKILKTNDRQSSTSNSNGVKTYTKTLDNLQRQCDSNVLYTYNLKEKTYEKTSGSSSFDFAVSNYLSVFENEFRTLAYDLENGEKFYININTFIVKSESESSTELLGNVKKKTTVKIVFGKESLSYHIDAETTREDKGYKFSQKATMSGSLQKKQVRLRKVSHKRYIER